MGRKVTQISGASILNIAAGTASPTSSCVSELVQEDSSSCRQTLVGMQARSQRFALGGSDFKMQKATPTFVSSLILLQY